MDGAQFRDYHMPRFAIALAVIALVAAALTPAAGATSPSEDQYGSAIPGGGGGNGNQSTSTSSGSGGSGETTIPVAPDTSSGTEGTGSSTPSGGGSTRANGSHTRSSDGSSKSGSSHGSDDAATPDNALSSPSSQNAGHSVPQIAVDSAGDSWVPFFVAALVALGAAGAFLIYRSRRAAQP
jgi:transglutaminase/protease-like cytokinesis protein 3